MEHTCTSEHSRNNTTLRKERKRELIALIDQLSERISICIDRTMSMVSSISPDELDLMLNEKRAMELRMQHLEKELSMLVTTRKESERIERDLRNRYERRNRIRY